MTPELIFKSSNCTCSFCVRFHSFKEHSQEQLVLYDAHLRKEHGLGCIEP